MTKAEAVVRTANGKKYVQQLCKHWSHKLPVEMDGARGVVTFVGAQATLDPDDECIRITIAGAEQEQVERLKGVVAEHVDRFAFREAPLTYDWSDT